MSTSDTYSRLLVVGGTGFIGRHIVQHALIKSWRVTSVSLTGNSRNTGEHLINACFDIKNPDAFQHILDDNRYDYVVNCSGYVDHSSLRHGGRRVFEDHMTGLLNIIDFLDHDSLKCFINIGSSDEYGQAAAPQREDMRESPIAPYSLAKTSASHLIQMLQKNEGFPGLVLRLFLTYGPKQNDARFIPQIIHGCLKGQPFPVSHGRQLRDFCFIQDVIEAIFLALETPSATGHIINIGSGQPVTIRELIQKIMDILKCGHPQFGALPYRPGESMELFPDTTKARNLLGWTANTSLDAGLKNTIDSFLD